MGRMRNAAGSVSRRAFVKALGPVAAAVAIGAPRIGRAAPDRLVVASGGGALDEAYKTAYYQSWTEETGIAIVSAPNETARIKAMVENNAVEWDVASLPAEEAAVLAREGLLEPIDYSIIDKSALLPGVAHEHLVVSDVAGYVMGWNTEFVSADSAPRTWADFWNASGPRGLLKLPYQTLDVALMADGVSKDELYPLDIDRAFASLDRIKSDIYWWERGAQSAQILIDGEVDMCAIWNGRIFQPKQEGAPVDFTLNQALFVSDAWAVPKGAPNKDAAMKFIAHALRPRTQAAFSNVIPYGPVNPAAFEFIDDERAAALPSSKQNFDKGVFLNIDWWAENGPKVSERFNAWLLG